MNRPFQISVSATSDFAIGLAKEHFDGAPIIEVPRTQSGQVGQCYENVRAKIRQAGGSHRLGWLLSMWPGRFVEALHHAIWLNPRGELEDVSDRAFEYMTASATTFIVAREQSLTGDDLTIPSKFSMLSEDDTCKAYVQAVIDLVSHKGRLMNFGQKKEIPRRRLGNGQISFSPTPSTQKKLIRLYTRVKETDAIKNERCNDLWLADQVCSALADGACSCGSGLNYLECHSLIHK